MDNPEALRTLQRIEKLLEQSVAAARSDTAAERTAAAQRATKSRGKNGDALSDETDKLHTSTKAARKAIFNLGADAKSTADSIHNLNTVIRGITASISTLKLDEAVDTKEVAGSIGALSAGTSTLTGSFDRLTRTSLLLRKAFQGLLADTRLSRKGISTSTSATIDNASAVIEGTAAVSDNAEANKKAARETSAGGSFFGGALGRFGLNLKDGGDKAEWLKSQFTNLGWALADAAINVTRDMFYLQSRGISAGDSLFELYGNAMKAGMSLQEYTSMLQENSAAVVRAGSFAEFGDSIDRTTRQLNRLGVFGPAAEQLAASLRTSAVTVGISRDQQEAAISSQVKLFEQLRKTTLMTADAFRELQADIASNQMVQEELLGLAPQERAARLAQITQGATFGYQLGATAQASKQLQDALLAQRRATVEERFKAAGMIRMGGAMMGMDTARVEEYARLMMKSPALRTEEEKKRIALLAADYQQFLQTLKSSPNPALENIADKLAALSPTVQSELQSAAGTVKLQAEAGLAQNADVGKQTSGFMQDIGRGLTALSGFMKNPLADAMVIFGSILAQTVVQSTLLAIIAKNTGSAGGIFRMFGGKGAPTPGAPKAPPLGGPKISPTIAAFSGIGRSLTSVMQSVRSTYQLLGPVAGSVSLMIDGISSITKVVKSAFGLLGKGGLFGAIFGSVEEIFTGEMTAALGLGDGIGGRLLGVITAGFGGLFTGFTRLIDGGINWVMEGLGISWRSNLTSFVDVATLSIVSSLKLIGSFFSEGWNKFKIGLLELVASFLTSLPGVSEDAPWVKSIRKSQKEAQAEIEAAESNRDAILTEYSEKREALLTKDENGKMKTLKDMGAEQIKAQKETADKSKQLTQATASNVVMGVENLMGAARTAAAQVAEVRQVPATIATPQPTQQPAVTPPEVNRAQAEQSRAGAGRPTGAESLTVLGMQELISNAQQQLDVMKQLLVATTGKQTGGAEKLAEQLARPSFSDNVNLYEQVLGVSA